MGNSNGKPVVFTDQGQNYPQHLQVRSADSTSWPASHAEIGSVGNIASSADFSPTVNLNHFRLLRVVGKGAFGKVRIVERKDTGLTFALKYIRKDEGQDLTVQCGSQHQLTDSYSRSIRKCAEHHTRAKNAGAPRPSLPLQFALQLSRHRISVSNQSKSGMIVG